MALGFSGEQLSSGHHALLIGQADSFPGFHGFVGGLQAGHADDGADHEVHLGMGGDAHRAGGAVDHFDVLQVVSCQAGPQFGGIAFGGHGDDSRTPAPGLLPGGFQISARGQAHDSKAVRIGLHDGERAAPDGAGRAKDGEGSH